MIFGRQPDSKILIIFTLPFKIDHLSGDPGGPNKSVERKILSPAISEPRREGDIEWIPPNDFGAIKVVVNSQLKLTKFKI